MFLPSAFSASGLAYRIVSRFALRHLCPDSTLSQPSPQHGCASCSREVDRLGTESVATGSFGSFPHFFMPALLGSLGFLAQSCRRSDPWWTILRCSGWDFDRFLQPCLYYGARSTKRTTGRPLLGNHTNQCRIIKYSLAYRYPRPDLHPPTMGSLGRLVNSSPVRLAVPSPRTLRPSPHLRLMFIAPNYSHGFKVAENTTPSATDGFFTWVPATIGTPKTEPSSGCGERGYASVHRQVYTRLLSEGLIRAVDCLDKWWEKLDLRL